MKLSTRGRYVVVAMTELALEPAGARVNLAELARREDISPAYLEQLFVKLRRAGLVLSVRGPGGGYALARPADEISIAEILLAVEETISALVRGGGAEGASSGTRAQSLANRLWEGFSAQVYVYLQRTTLGDVVRNRLAPCPAVPQLFQVTE